MITTEKISNPSLAVMALDLMDSIVQASTGLDEFLDSVAGSIRELTGARTVIILQGPEPPVKILRIVPERRMTLFSGKGVAEFLEAVSSYKDPGLLQVSSLPAEAEELLQGNERDSSALLPLITPRGRVATILALGLMSPEYVESMTQVYNMLSGMIGVTFENLLLLKVVGERSRELDELRKNLEKQVEKRTEELRDTQAQLLQSQKLEAVGRLAGGVAHDFNNLLTVIEGHAEMLRSASMTHGEVMESSRAISHASERAAALTAHLLAFSRKQDLQPQSFFLCDFLKSLQPIMERLLPETISTEFSCDDPVRNVFIDPVQLQQVLLNLVVNARDAMPGGGSVTVAAEEARREVLPDELLGKAHEGSRFVCINVRDNGPGIPPEIRQRIFEPFFSTKDRSRGSGLGLATVYGILTQSGGGITLESTPGEGCHFRCFLPVTDRESSFETDDIQEEDPGGSETILLVEDEESIRTVLKAVLKAKGFSVFAARSGDEALEMIKGGEVSPHIIVSDVIMPGMNGMEMIKRIRELHSEQKFLLISGYSDDVVTGKGYITEDIPFMQKPFTGEALSLMIRRVLNNEGGWL